MDYISFTGLFVHYLHNIVSPSPSSVEPSLIQSRAPPPAESTSAITSVPITSNLPGVLLILGGYSYGSLIASHLPAIDAILERFTNIANDGSVEAEIRLRAQSLSTQWNKEAHESRMGHGLRANHKLGGSSRISFGGEETEPGSRRTSRESRRSLDVIRRSVDRSRKLMLRTQCAQVETSNEAHFDFTKIPEPQTCYLLISPLLPPISLLLTMFSRLSGPFSFKDDARSSQSKRKTSSTTTEEQLVNHPTLAIYGDSDLFTSRKSLRKWAEGLSERPSSMFQFREIGGAGHFWQEEGVDAKMRASLREWLQSCRIS